MKRQISDNYRSLTPNFTQFFIPLSNMGETQDTPSLSVIHTQLSSETVGGGTNENKILKYLKVSMTA
jgi:hypothetical protein